MTMNKLLLCKETRNNLIGHLDKGKVAEKL